MYIITYLIAIISIILFPYISGGIMICSSFFINKKLSILYLIIGCILINVIFLDVTTGNGLDIDRYIQNTQYLQSFHGIKNVFGVINNSGYFDYQKPSYLFFVLEIIASRTQHLTVLPFLSSILTTFFIFYPFYDLAQNSKNNKFVDMILAISAFLLVGYGFWIASTMRWCLAVSSVFCVDYIFFTKLNERKYVPILLIPVFFHIGITLVVAMSLILAFSKKVNNLSLILLSGLIALTLFLENTMPTFSNQFLNQLVKMNNSYTNDATFVNNQMSSQAAILPSEIATFSIILIWFLIPHFKKRITNDSFSKLVLALIIMGLLYVSRVLIFERFLIIIFLFVTFDVAKYFCTYKIKLKFNAVGLIIFFLFLLVIGGSWVRGYLKFRANTFSIGSPADALVSNLIKILQNIPFYMKQL